MNNNKQKEVLKVGSFAPFLWGAKEDLHFLCRNCEVCKGHIIRMRYVKVKRLTKAVRDKYTKEFGPIIGESKDLFEGHYLWFVVDLADE